MSSSNIYVRPLGNSTLAMSAATVNGFAYKVLGSTNVVLQATWTATPVGTWNFQTSQDGTNWNTLAPASSGQQVVASTDSSSQFIMNLMPAIRYVRLQWVGTSGTATATISCDSAGIEV